MLALILCFGVESVQAASIAKDVYPLSAKREPVITSAAALPLPIKDAIEPTPSPISKAPHRLRLPRQRMWRSLNQIYEFDHTPLGNRLPVLLLPGRAEEFQQNSWWRSVYRRSRQDAVFRHRFKLYLFLYDSKEELDVQAKGLAQEVRKYFWKLPKHQPLMLVSYSLGGVIAREVLEDSAILDRVDTMIAIAVPFHGSPLFDPNWFADYLNPSNHFPLRRFWDRLLYRSYMFNRSNLTRGLKWDNFDRSKPQFHLNGFDKASNQARSYVPGYEEYPNADAIRRKMIVYSSYLENDYTQEKPFTPSRSSRYILDRRLISWPRQLLTSLLPFYGFTVHSVFTYTNFQLANIPTYTPDDPMGKVSHLYRFNDGAIPMSSMLFLKPSVQPYAQDLNHLVEQASVRKVRVFVNLDHTHLGEYAQIKQRLIRPDVLHQEDGALLPNQWILFDLKRRMDELADPLHRPPSPVIPQAPEPPAATPDR
jgi:hypothetical protein